MYGKTRWGAAYLAGALAYSFHDVTTNRTVTIAGNDALAANFRANVFSGRLEGGYRYAMPWLTATPYGALQVHPSRCQPTVRARSPGHHNSP